MIASDHNIWVWVHLQRELFFLLGVCELTLLFSWAAFVTMSSLFGVSNISCRGAGSVLCRFLGGETEHSWEITNGLGYYKMVVKDMKN